LNKYIDGAGYKYIGTDLEWALKYVLGWLILVGGALK